MTLDPASIDRGAERSSRHAHPTRRPTRRAARRGARSAGRRPTERVLAMVAGATAVALVASACGGAPPRPGPDESPAAYSGIGVDADRIDYAVGKLEDIIDEEQEAAGVPGVAVAVVHEGEVVFERGVGVRDTTTDAPVDVDTVFPLAGISAAVSATVVAAGIADGTTADEGSADTGATADEDSTDSGATAEDAEDAVDWSTPVRELLPEFALSDPRITPLVTVGDLFAHRSGLPEHAGDELEEIGLDRRGIIERLRHLPLDSFRDSFAVTDFGLTTGAEAVARRAGTPWDDLARERILDPLRMLDSSYAHADLEAHPDRAVGHVRAVDTGSGTADGDWIPATPPRDPDEQSPASGLSSSVADMSRWMAMVLADGVGPNGNRIVPAGALREVLTPHTVSAPPTAAADRPGGYGYGFEITTSSSGRVMWGHSGGFPRGAGTSMLMIPSLDLGIITLTNSAPVGVAESINARFADLAQYGDPVFTWRDVYGPALAPTLDPQGDLVGEEPPSDPEAHRPLDELEGTYRNDYLGELRVARAGDSLTLEPVGRDLGPWSLEHWDGDTFALAPTDEHWNPGSRGSVFFDGDRMTVDLLDRVGQGTLTREDDDGGDSPDGGAR